MTFDDLAIGIRAIDGNNWFLALLLCLAGAYMLKEIIQPPGWVTLVSIPWLIVGGFVALGTMKAIKLYPTGDDAINTIIGTSLGLVVAVVIGVIVYAVQRSVAGIVSDRAYERRRPNA